MKRRGPGTSSLPFSRPEGRRGGWFATTRRLEAFGFGVSFYWRGDGTVATSVAQVFDERGDGVVVQGADNALDRRQAVAPARRRPRAALQRAEGVPRRAQAPAPPTSSSTTTWLNRAETDGMLRAVDDERRSSPASSSGSQKGRAYACFRSGQQPPLRGTFVELENEYGLLYTRGAVECYGTYQGCMCLVPSRFARPCGNARFGKLHPRYWPCRR